jgi:hypothetical protein
MTVIKLPVMIPAKHQQVFRCIDLS